MASHTVSHAWKTVNYTNVYFVSHVDIYFIANALCLGCCNTIRVQCVDNRCNSMIDKTMIKMKKLSSIHRVIVFDSTVHM